MKNIIITVFKLTLLFAILITSRVYGQDRIKVLDSKLLELSKSVPGLVQPIEISVNGVSVQEFVRGIALTNNVNISIDPAIQLNIVNNFSNVPLKDVLLFLCEKNELDLKFIGNIISISKYDIPTPIPTEKPKKKENIKFNSANGTFILDLKNDTIASVVKEITRLSGFNIVTAPGMDNKLLSGYIQDLPLKSALEKICYSNDLKSTQAEDGSFVIEKNEVVNNDNPNTKQKNKGAKNSKTIEEIEPQGFTYKIDSGYISLEANAANIADIINIISDKLGINYFIYSDIKGVVTTNMQRFSYEQMVATLLNGTTYTFFLDNNIYLIGERKLETIRETKTYKFANRSVDKIMEFIPVDIKKDVDIKEFPELNSIILCGSRPSIAEIENFLRKVDQLVPVIMIEVLIIDSKTGHIVSTGITAGISKTPVQSGGSVFPELNYSLSSSSINNIINSINGFGIINLGKVTSEFYISLKALEENGTLKVNSTPKLATLNGHEAKLSIGNTEYYLEETSNFITNQTTQNIVTKQYKPLKADLSVKIKPFVSGGDQITLDVEVQQTDFTSKSAPTAPYGSVTRSFSSLIRIKNEEMVLLGGLEKKSTNTSSSGVPGLSRVPVLKWFFSSSKRERSSSKLNIFIKPTIIY